jgi:hypothetical protein
MLMGARSGCHRCGDLTFNLDLIPRMLVRRMRYYGKGGKDAVNGNTS